MPQSPNSFITNRQFKYFGFLVAIIIVFNSCFKDDLLKEINDLKIQVSNMQKLNDSLNSLLNARADSLSKALSNAQKRSDSLSNVLRTKSDSLAIALGLTNANLVNLSRSVDSIKTQVATINGQLTQLNLQLTSITTQLSQLNQQMGALSADVSQLAGQYAALNSSLQTINSQIAALQAEQLKQIEKLNAILAQLNQEPASLKVGLMAYYPFNGNTNDESGNGFHGINFGATLTSDRFSNVSSAYNFDGVPGTRIQSNYPGILGTQSRSISVWVNKIIPVTASTPILTWGLPSNNTINVGGGSFFSLFMATWNGAPFVGMDNGYSAIGVKKTNLSDGLWHNYTVVFDNSLGTINSNLKIYIDGVLSQNDVIYNALNLNTMQDINLVIGGFFWSSTGELKTFNGKIDDVRVYNRVLTDSEISYLATH